MKRNYIPFIAGMSTMLLLVGLVGASLAGETRPPAVPQSGTLNGQVAYGEAGVALRDSGRPRNRYLPALPGLRRTERRSPLC